MMFFEHRGMSVWWGMPDTPPRIGEVVRAGTEIPVTIGVRPADTSNRVEVLYRINNGPVETVPAKWLRNDTLHKAQYFTVRLPAFRAGDTVEYVPVYRWAGRQVPPPERVDEFTSSLQVVEVGEESIRELKLSIGMYGDEVELLHRKLRHHGFDIPATEADRQFFGP